jgi:hypothetical protein
MKSHDCVAVAGRKLPFGETADGVPKKSVLDSCGLRHPFDPDVKEALAGRRQRSNGVSVWISRPIRRR